MLRTAFVLAVLLGLTTTTMLTEPKEVTDSSPATVSSQSKIEGTLTVQDVKYQLKHICAIEAKLPGETHNQIILIVSSEPLASTKIEALRTLKDVPPSLKFFQPHVVISYTTQGKPIKFNGWGGDLTFGRSSSDLGDLGELKLANGHFSGTAKHSSPHSEPKFRFAFDFRFDVPKGKKPENGNDNVDSPSVLPVSATTGESIPAPGSNIQEAPTPAEIQTCVNGRCNLYGGLHVDPEKLRHTVGAFAIVTTPQGIIRINSINGASSLLSISADGNSAEWRGITEGPRCSADQSFYWSNTPVPAPAAAAAPQTGK